MVYNPELIDKMTAEAYFNYLMMLRDVEIVSDKPDAEMMQRLKDEVEKTGLVDGYLLRWKEEVAPK